MEVALQQSYVVDCCDLPDPEGLIASLLDAGINARSRQDIDVSFLRDLLEKLCPAYCELCAELRSRLCEGGGYRFVVLRGLPFLPYHAHGIEELLLCFAASLGIPTETDHCYGRRVWPVTPRQDLPLGHRPTVTEHHYMAALHTDSAYRPIPEKYVMLYAVRPAQDGGGELSVVDGRLLLDKLSQTSEGLACLDVLRKTMFSFSVPDSFTRTVDPSEH